MTTGCNDPVIVGIPKGSYVPKFDTNLQIQSITTRLPSDNQRRSSFSTRWLIVGGAVVLATLLAFSWRYFDLMKYADFGEISRDKIAQISKNSEAQILFQQAFVLLMPPQDDARLISSKELFQRVIEIDPKYGGGYAGKSIAFSLQILFLKSKDPAGDIRQAIALAKSSVDKDLEYSLGYSALAFAQSLKAETGNALANIRRVVSIQPHNGNANVIAGLALLISGESSTAVDFLSEALSLDSDEPRTPYLNLLGIAYYLEGNYSEAAISFEKNLARIGPSGPHIDVFIAATYAQIGEGFKAQAMIEKLQRTSPDYPVERWLGNYIKSEDELQTIMSTLQSLGLSQ